MGRIRSVYSARAGWLTRRQERQVQRRARQQARESAPVEHGTVRAYKSQYCRCLACCRANTRHEASLKAARVERLEKDPSLAQHGTFSTYNNWGCRCEECAAAARAVRSRYSHIKYPR